MARRGRKILLYVVVGLAVVLIGLVISMRIMRHRHKPAEEVRNGVIRVRNFFTEIYGVRVGKRVLVFDAGVDPDGGALDALAEALKTNRDGVTDVFLTHGHFDHIAAAPLCKNARIHLGIQDADMAAKKSPMIPWGANAFEKLLPVPVVNLTDAILDQAELPLDDGKAISLIPLPGHTAGSYMFLYEGILFAGDSIQIDDGKLIFSNPPFTVDLAQSKRGIANLKGTLGGKTVAQICTGHQGCTVPADTQRMLDDLIERAKQ